MCLKCDKMFANFFSFGFHISCLIDLQIFGILKMLSRRQRSFCIPIRRCNNHIETDIEFTSKDFELMRKVTMILRFFHKATQMLSEDDCSVLCPCQSPLFFINLLLSYSL